ncbi:MAG TPA: hypothetical protein VK759_02855 [Rhizomicrobium sp.]|nr:hypothetical protein [Rhizomicrobium sp.]HSZ73392.1 hypothetical protein [Rhizomicrobium sp.]
MTQIVLHQQSHSSRLNSIVVSAFTTAIIVLAGLLSIGQFGIV